MVTMPSTAWVSYEYESPIPFLVNTDQVLLRYPKQKTLTYHAEYDGGTTLVPEVSQYNINRTNSVITSPDGSVTTEYHGDTSYEHKDRGLVYKTISSTGSISERIWNYQNPPAANGILDMNPYVRTEFTTIPDASGNPSLTKIMDYTVDLNGNRTEAKEYDWVAYNSVPRDSYGGPTGIPGGAILKRTTSTEYYNSTSTNINNGYWAIASPNVRNAVKSVEVKDGTDSTKSRSEMFYDNASTTTNLIQVSSWDSFKNGTSQPYTNPLTPTNSVSTTTQFDQYGNPTLVTDAKGVQTKITYGAVNGYSGLYPTMTETAYGTAVQRTSTAAYDFYTGLATSTTDVDNNLTNAAKYDALGRPAKAITAVNTALESWTRTEYDDTLRRVVVRSDLETKGDGKKIAIQHFDQLGRVRLSRSIENVATENPYNEYDGIKVQTRYEIGNPDSYQLTSNPYRAATAAGATNEESMGWTRSRSVNTGRHSEVETFTGANLPAPWGSNTNTTGKVQTDIDADRTLVTDQAGKQRRSVTNALGQLIRVDEPDIFDNLGTISAPKQPTEYTYNALNNLTTVTQNGTTAEQCGGTTSTCIQTRSFVYDSLSRLKSATNPESGTVNYLYDNNGNLLTKTDARSVVTSFSYDALNRVTFRNYSDATPDISYFYDDVPNSRGKLTRTTSMVSETLFNAFDVKGRVLGSEQVTDGQTYGFNYAYNLNGNLLSQTYPSGKVVKYDYSNDGSLAKVFNNQTQKIYADSFDYTAHGQVERLRLGNGKWETTKFNSRLQIVQIGLGFSANDTGLWKTNYEFGSWETGTINSQKNNNSLAKQTIDVPSVGQMTGFSAVQAYSYDNLDRLTSAVEAVSSVEKWKQTFLYDRFGNRHFDASNTTLLSVESNVPKVVNPEVLPSNNQYKPDQDNDGQTDYLYDSSGNLTKDAQNRTFTYDAENRQSTAVGVNLSVSFAYDGNDKRVRTLNAINNQATIFVYDAGGELAAEYTINLPPPTSPTVSYLTEDALGSPRVITNSFGEVKSRRDFLPFGEELSVGIGSRTIGQKYSADADNTRQKFTEYQRDVETHLDYAQSRYYSAMFGRYTSPDEFKSGPEELFDFEDDARNNPTFYADLINPQSLNKYQYAYNNPCKYRDSTGHCPERVVGAIAGAIVGGVAGFLVGTPTGAAGGAITCSPIGPEGTLLCGAAGAISGQLLGTLGGAILGGFTAYTFIPCPQTQMANASAGAGAMAAPAPTQMAQQRGKQNIGKGDDPLYKLKDSELEAERRIAVATGNTARVRKIDKIRKGRGSKRSRQKKDTKPPKKKNKENKPE